MSANNDFFVKFDSNATQWAAQLEQQLAPARKSVVALQRALYGLEGKANQTGQKVQAALAQQAGRAPAPGGGSGVGRADPTVLREAIHAQADAVKGVNEELKLAATSLKAAAESVSGIPGRVQATLKSLSDSIAHIRTQSGGNAARYHLPDSPNRMVASGTPGAIQYGSSESQVNSIVRRAMAQGLGASASGARFGSGAATPSIGTIRRSDIDRANFDRVIAAIQFQTRTLSQGLHAAPVNVVEGSGSARPTATTKVAAPAKAATKTLEQATTQIERDLAEVRKDLAEANVGLTKAMKLAAGGTDEAMNKMLEEVRQGRDKLAARARDLERRASGITKTDQSAQAKKEYASRETITDVEKDRRTRLSSLINSPGASDFDTRLGSARTEKGGNYSVGDLRQMAAAFNEIGIVVRATAKMRKPELAANLKAAFEQYSQLHPEGAPELDTKNVQVSRTTKIAPATSELLGDIEHLIAQRVAARQVIGADRLTGGQKLSGVEKEDVTKLGLGTVSGRRSFGGAILGEEVPSPIARGGTPADVIRAYQQLAARPQEQFPRVQQLARAGSFNPFDLSHNIKVGSDPEEQDRGRAAQARLRDIRQATLALDKLGKEYFDLEKALNDSRKFIEGATARIESGNAHPDDVTNVQKAQDSISANTLAQNEVLNKTSGLVASPEYARGYALRNTPVIPFAESPAERYSNASRRASETGGTLGDYRLMREATAGAVLGINTVPGSKNLMRQVPGLTYGGGRYTSTEGLSRENQERLDKSTNDLTRAQLQRSRVLLDATSTAEQVQEAEDKLERAANSFANRIERMFNGIAPPLQTLTGGRSFQTGVEARIDPQVAIDEDRRRTARELAEAERTRKFEDTPKSAVDRAQLSVQLAEKRLARATQERADVQERAAKIEAQIAEKIPDPTAREHALGRFTRLDDQAYSKQLAVNRLTSLRGDTEDPNNYGGLQGVVSKITGRLEGDRIGSPTTGEGHMFGPEQTLKSALAKLDAHIVELEHTQATVAQKDTHGYDSSLGYHSPASDERLNQDLALTRSTRQQMAALSQHVDPNKTISSEIKRLETEIQSTLRERQAVSKGAGLNDSDVASLSDLSRIASTADKEVAQLEAQLAKATEAMKTAQKALETKTTAEKAEGAATKKTAASVVEKTAAEANGRIAEIRARQTEVRASGPYTRSAVSELYKSGGRNDPEYLAARARRDELSSLRKELTGLTGGGKGGGGGGGTLSGAAGAEGGDPRSLLAQILATLKAMHATLKGGIKVTDRTAARADQLAPETATGGRKGTSRAQTASLAELQAAGVVAGGSGSDDDLKAAMEAQRRRQNALRASQYTPVRTLADGTRVGGTGTHVDAAYAEYEATGGLGQSKFRQQTAGLKDESTLRAEIRAKNQLKETTALLSRETEQEIRVLRELTAAAARATTAEQKLAAQEKIVAQQTKVAGSINSDLKGQGYLADARRQATRTVLNDAGPKVSGGELDQVLGSVRGNPKETFQRNGEEAGEGMGNGALSGFAKIFGGSNGFFDRILHTTGTFIVRNFAAGFVFGLTNELQQVATQAIKTESTFVRVSSALHATGKDVGNIRSQLQSVSTDYGIQLNDVYETAAGLVGLFGSTDEIAGATRISAQLQLISDGALNASEALGVLASTASAFSAAPGEAITDKLLPGGIQGLNEVADVFTSIQNNMGVNVEDSSEGVARMAGSARELKISLAESAVFVAQISKQTNLTGAAAGDQFSRILAGLQTGRGRASVEKAYGQDAFVTDKSGSVDYGKTLEKLIGGWDKLSDSQKREITTSVAGQKNMASFNALMNDGQHTLNALSAATNSYGDANARAALIANTLQNRLARFRAQLQDIASGLVQTGVLNFLGAFLVVADQVAGAVNKILTAFNRVADSNSFLGFLRDTITFLLGAGLAIKALQFGISGLKGAMAGGEANSFRGGVRNALGKGANADADVAERKIAERAALSEEATLEERRANYIAQRAAAAEPAVAQRYARPAYSTYGRPVALSQMEEVGANVRRSPITRSVGYTLDRTVGITSEAAMRGLSAASGKAAEGLSRGGVASNKAAAMLDRLALAAERNATFARTGFQAAGSGRFGPGGIIGGLGNRLAGRAEGQFEQAERLRYQYANQTQFARYAGSPTDQAAFRGRLAGAGLTEAEIAAHTAAPNARLLSSADSLERAGRISGSAAGGMTKLGGSLSALAASGALADGAMIAVGVLVAGFISNIEHGAEIARQVEAGYQASFGSDAGKTQDQVTQEQYVGPNQQNFSTDWENRMKGGFFGNLNRGASGIAAVAGGFFKGRSASDSLERLYGTNDNNQTYGLDLANQAVTNASTQLDQTKKVGGTSDDFMKVQADWNDRISKAAELIKNDDSLSESQKQAALGNLEQARKAIADQVDGLVAVADGAQSALRLTTDQIQGISDLISARQSLQNVHDLPPGILKGFADDTGLVGDKKLGSTIAKLTDPNTSEVGELIANRKLLHESVIQLYANWKTKLISDPQEAQAIKGQLQSTLQQYGQATDQIVQALQANADELSTEARNAGRNGRALQISTGAIRSSINQLTRGRFKNGTQYSGNALKDLLSPNRAPEPQIPVHVEGGKFAQLYAVPKIPTARQIERSATRDLKVKIRSMTPKQRQQIEQAFQALAAHQLELATKDLQLKLAAATNPAEQAALQAAISSMTANFYKNLQQGKGTLGVPKDLASALGPSSTDAATVTQNQVQAIQDQKAAVQAQRQQAQQLRQDQASIIQAQLGVRQAYAEARGDAVGSARVQAQIAKAAIAAAKADLAAAVTADETAQARAALYQAQAQLVAANAATADAQEALVQSQYQVTIALADAAGNTVESARRTLAAARQALGNAIRKSGGKNTAEVNQARAQAIQAEASLRDAKLQDSLDTIDFNLQMGKITQQSAIRSLQEILRTQDLTKAQRRQLLLQIKGMQDSMKDAQWNFGSIKLPTPYQMRRYIAQQRKNVEDTVHNAAKAAADTDVSPSSPFSGPASNAGSTVNNTYTTTVQIDGADTAKVEKVIRDVLGKPGRTLTTAPRRRI